MVFNVVTVVTAEKGELRIGRKPTILALPAAIPKMDEPPDGPPLLRTKSAASPFVTFISPGPIAGSKNRCGAAIRCCSE